MDKYQLTKELLQLVDSSPMNWVDITPIVEKYTEGLDIEQQRGIRVGIKDALRRLKESEEIEFSENGLNGIAGITAFQAQIFFSNGGNIKSTYKRQKGLDIKKDKEQQSAKYSTTFNAPFAGNFSQGNAGDLKQSVIEESVESKELAKKTLADFPKNKWYRHWLFIVGVLTLLAAIIAIALSGK